jgi:hypothetical protein
MSKSSLQPRTLSDGEAALYRWIEQGVFDCIFEAVCDEPDMEWLAIDATVIRAQAQAAGARAKRGR